MRSPHQSRVEEFMLKAGQVVRAEPGLPTLEERRLRARLILEEALETVSALGFDVPCHECGVPVSLKPEVEEHEDEPCLWNVIDGCADLTVVTTGTLSACGVNDQPILEAVDASNLSKFREGHSFREDGKLIKSPLYEPLDVERVIRGQRRAKRSPAR